MKACAGRSIKIAFCILLILSLCGCWNSRELDDLGIVMGVGVDTTDGSSVKITAQVVKAAEIKSTKNDSGSKEAIAFWNIQNIGNTVFDTIRGLTRKSSRRLFFPHNQVIVFGHAVAEEGLQKYMDFFTRDPETRDNVWVLVSEGTAEEMLNVKSELEKIPANNMAKLIKDEASSTSQTGAVRLREFITRRMSKTTAPVAPIVGITGEGDEKIVAIAGTAVFKDDKLVGEMDRTEGRGLLWVLGEVKSGIIEIEGPDKRLVSTEIIRASGKMEPEVKNNQINIKITINEEGNIGEQEGTLNLSRLDAIALLEKNKSELIKNEVQAAVKKAKELNADVFGFGEAVHKKYPKQWKDLEGKWEDIFRTIKVEVNVEAKLRLMGRTILPAVPAQEKE